MPDLLVLGQVTVDHAVPATPGPWRESLGGNALYAVAGARLWCDPGRVGVVTRLGRGLAGDVTAILGRAGLPTGGLTEVDAEPLVEWHLYERDGSRRSFPRNAALRDPTADAATLRQRYLAHLEGLSPTAADIPSAWLPTRAVHVAPQVAARHGSTVAWLAERANWVGVDPSPHYARHLEEGELTGMLGAARALLPSRAEVEHLVPDGDWVGLIGRLREAGLEEVVVKLGGAGCLVAGPGVESPRRIPAAPADVVDLTGAGDAFCGAYAAARLGGLDPLAAGRRGAIAAAMVIECTGAAAALALSPGEAERRLGAWMAGAQR
jgi:sugar/nucleoside kinase (ribokinase family)